MTQWPVEIREYIEDRFGPAPEVHGLGGMGGEAVVRIEGRGRSAILKRGFAPGRNPRLHSHGGTDYGARREHSGALHVALDAIREATLSLFEPRYMISGDPNPANWGAA